jgi:DNA helicase II / ATP-dependent DNA helicase PcrA
LAWNDDLPQQTPAYGIASDDAERTRVVAGPGTGKSFSLRRRVARLVEQGAEPERILAVTFTRIAAEDIRREMHSLDVEGAESIYARTLHSLAMSILSRRHVVESLGRETRPMGTFEVEPLLHDLSRVHGDKRRREKRLEAYLAAFATDQNDDPLDCADQADREFRRELVSWLTFHRAMLIGELIPFFYTYLRDNPAAQEFGDFDHILVDEYQDLNKVEQGVVELMGRDASLMIVGDENQSIYSFKHAHPEGILEWEEENDDRSDHQLVECYRCPRRVVSMANSLIANNQGGAARPLRARRQNGEGVVSILQFQTSESEADGIVADIVRRIEAGTRPEDILVLTTRKVLGMKIADRLREAAVAHREYLRESVLQSDEVTERLCLLLLVADRDNRPALRWLIGRGHATFRAPQYQRLRELCEDEDAAPWDVLCSIADDERPLPHTAQMIERFREIRQRVEALQILDDPEDIVEELFPDGDDEFARIRELVAEELEDDTDIAAITSIIWEKMYEPDFPDDAEYVRVMTLYGSKGLGTPIVYVTSLNEGLLPSLPEEGDTPQTIARKIAEQRRLFYVALTRAKTESGRGLPGELILSGFRLFGYDEAHRFNGGNMNARASRFLAELGPDAPRAQRG